MYDSDLIVRVLNGQLNRNLPKYVDIARSELEYAWDIEIPQTDGESRNFRVSTI